MIQAKAESVDEYIKSFPADVQAALQQIRSTILKVVPTAEQVISYAIPCMKMNGRMLVYFAGYKSHVSVYPAPRNDDAFKEELAAYKGGKGTVQFPLTKPLPLDLITRIVKYLLQQNEAKAKTKTKKK